jgi:hypothetical protein
MSFLRDNRKTLAIHLHVLSAFAQKTLSRSVMVHETLWGYEVLLPLSLNTATKTHYVLFAPKGV